MTVAVDGKLHIIFRQLEGHLVWDFPLISDGLLAFKPNFADVSIDVGKRKILLSLQLDIVAYLVFQTLCCGLLLSLFLDCGFIQQQDNYFFFLLIERHDSLFLDH